MPNFGDYFYGYLYRALGTPRIRLSGIRADMDALYDGTMITATTNWWNQFRGRRPALGFRRYDEERAQRLIESVNPVNRRTLKVIAKKQTRRNDSLADAAVALAYSLARTFGAGMTFAEGTDGHLLSPAQPVTLASFEAHISSEDELSCSGAEMYPLGGWWSWYAYECLDYEIAVRAIRWTYSNQIDRWGKGEGRKLGFPHDLFRYAGEFYAVEIDHHL